MSAENSQAAHLPHPADPSLDPRERRNAVLYQNLLLAVAARKADRSPYYAPNLSHGTTTPDLDRSTAAAGEDPEALKAHLCLFDRLLGRLAGLVAWAKAGVAPASSLEPQPGSAELSSNSAAFLGQDATPSPDKADAPSLQPGSAELSSNSAASPASDANPSPGQDAGPQNPASATPLVVTAASPRPLKLVRALALLAWRPLRLLHTQAWWECRAVCFLLHELIEWRRRHGPLTPKRLNDFQYEIGQALSDPIWQTERVKTVQRRWELLWQALFDPEGWAQRLARSIGLASPGSRFHPNWMERLDQLPPEALANPGRSPGEIVKALERRQQRAVVKDPKAWKTPAAAAPGDAQNATAGEATPPAPRKRRPRTNASSLAYDESLTRRYDPRHRQPPDRVLRRLEKRGRIHVPATFEEFQKLVQAALGTSPDVDPRPRGGKKTRRGVAGGLPNAVDLRVAGVSKAEGSRAARHPKARRGSPSGAPQGSAAAAGEPDASLRGVAQALWARMNYGRERADQVASLLAASLAWDTPRMCQLWRKLLKAEYAFDNIFDLQFRYGAEARFMRPASALASGGSESAPAESGEAEAEERQAEAEEVWQAARIWFGAVCDALTGGMAGQHKSLVALYELAVDRFGIRYEFLEWRPALSPNQWTERKERPEWQVRVVTVDGKAWARLEDGRIVEARSENGESEGRSQKPGVRSQKLNTTSKV